MELRSAGPAATSMEFVLTSTTPGAARLVSSAEEMSRRIALEFATKVEELKVLWNALQKSPEELLRAEPPAEFIKAVEVMKQMVQESLAASQLPKQSARLSTPACADSEAVELSTGEPVDVKSEPGTGEPSLESTSIFVGSIPRDWTDEYLHAYLGGQARIIKRYHVEAKMGHAEVEVPKGHRLFDLDQKVAN